jgi:hypothetical protein
MMVVQPARGLAEPAPDAIPRDGPGHPRHREAEACIVTPVGSGLHPDRAGPANAAPRAHGGETPTAS